MTERENMEREKSKEQEPKEFAMGSLVKFRNPDDRSKYNDTNLRYVNQVGEVTNPNTISPNFVLVKFPDGHEDAFNKEDLIDA